MKAGLKHFIPVEDVGVVARRGHLPVENVGVVARLGH